MEAMKKTPLRVTVIDMQPITPAVGGGRQRLLGLYHALGTNIECTYVGSYDWPGEAYHDNQLTPGLREIVVPLSAAHHAAAAALSERVGGRTVIDSAFSDQVGRSPEYLSVAREHIVGADIVVFSHPWCFLPLADALRVEQLVVYDSHNVEALLRTELLGDLDAAREVLEIVFRTEQALLSRADLVLVCSEEDVALFQQIFDTDPLKLRIAPNGAFVENFPEPGAVQRQVLRKKLGLPLNRPVAIFLGSLYGPNTDAARFIMQQLVPVCPDVFFVIAGGVGNALEGEPVAANMMVTGRVDDEHRDELLLAADIALNPMNAGSGTNIKMFDYMAAGLPVLTTEIGARGIGTSASAPTGIFVEPLESFPSRCVELTKGEGTDFALRQAVRDTVRRCYSWERISRELGALLSARCARQHATYGPRIAVMSTWNITCGIGEHSAYLAEALTAEGAQVLVLGNSFDGHQSLGFERDLHNAVSRVWRWDNQAWRDSGIDMERFSSVLTLSRSEILIIQHHTGYVPFAHIESAVRRAHAMGIRVLVEMHDGRNVPIEHKERLCAAGASLIVHHVEEKNGIGTNHASLVHVLPLPVRHASSGRDHAVISPREREGSLIGGFGFLRPYKGLMIAVKTLAILRHTYPKLRYQGWHALYSGEESQRHLRECMEEAERLGVRDAIEVDTRFLPIEEVLAHLQTVDAVLMPYEPSDEGASAAVNLALAAGRPVVASSSAIFRAVAHVIRIAPRHTPDAYAKVLDGILSDPSVASELTQRAVAWATENSYTTTALTLLAIADRGTLTHCAEGISYA